LAPFGIGIIKLQYRGFEMDKKQEYWIRQSKSFDESADYYDKFRPSYPEELVMDIINKTGVDSRSKVLEVGPGSGKATELFVDKGLNIIGIEPGVNLAAQGKKKFQHTGQVEYIVSRFEDWNEEREAYDLIVSAQAFHWVPKPLGYQKCFNALKRDKYVGLFWNFYLSRGQEIEVELQNLFNKYPVAYLDNKESLERRIQKNADEIEFSGYFKNLEVIRYPWSETCNCEDYIGFLRTGNGYLTLSENERAEVEDRVNEIIQSYGGSVTRYYECTLFLAQKV
jgi:hypothetical protein